MGKRKKVEVTERLINDVLTPGKECTKCGEWKPLTAYCKNSHSPIGLQTACKSCRNARNRSYYSENASQINEIRRTKYTVDVKYKESRRNHARSSYKRNYEKTKYVLRTQRRRALKRHLPCTLTESQMNEIYKHYGGCALSNTNDIYIEFDHVIPLAVGHGGTIYENMIPLRADLNESKGDDNIFEWFEANKERFNLSEERFNKLIEYLATVNGLTVDEYRQFVYWCHENPREPHEIAADPRHSIEIWREATGRHFPLPAYAIENDNMSDKERSAS